MNPDTALRVAAAVYLLHQRRGWAWTLGASLVALVAFVAVGTILWPNATGAVSVISGLIVIVLLAVAVVALTAVITDTVLAQPGPARQPFSVRQPWWNGWGGSLDLMNAGAAGSAIAGCLFGELGSVFLGVGLVRMMRRRLWLP